jgi:hypothetical protein
VVEDDQAVVVQTPKSSTFAVGVSTVLPKFRPEIVTETPPLSAILLSCRLVMTAASNVKTLRRVPIAADTVMVDVCLTP